MEKRGHRAARECFRQGGQEGDDVLIENRSERDVRRSPIRAQLDRRKKA
jgi:hypothetical protein